MIPRIATLALFSLAASSSIAACSPPRFAVSGPMVAPSLHRAVEADVPLPVEADGSENGRASLPAGWSAPAASPQAPKHHPRIGSRGDLLAALSPPRGGVSPIAIDLDSIPRFEVEPEPGATPAPAILEGERVPEIVTFGWRVSVRDHSFGGIAIGFASQPFSRFAEGGTMPTMSHGVTEASWVFIDREADGAVTLQSGSGFYDVDRHRAVAVYRSPSFRTAPLADGKLYAFRTSCPRCAARQERLHLITPLTEFGAAIRLVGDAHIESSAGADVTLVELPLEPGTTGAFEASIGLFDRMRWSRHFDADARAKKEKDFKVGVATSRGEGGAPVAIAYLASE